MTTVSKDSVMASSMGLEGTPRRYERQRHAASHEPPNRSAARVGDPTHPRALGQSRRCSYAYAVAAARDDTPSLAKMLLTCRSIVRSLSTSRAAIALLLSPAARRRST